MYCPRPLKNMQQTFGSVGDCLDLVPDPRHSFTLKRPRQMRTFNRLHASFILGYLCCSTIVCGQSQTVSGERVSVDPDVLRAALHFHAPFDDVADAKRFTGDGRIMTAESLERKTLTPGIHRSDVQIVKGAGKYRDCLRFTGKTSEVLCFAGTEMHYAEQDWSGSVSVWLRLNPDEDLLPGYCDPLQITQFAWNNGAFFIDFDKDLPRDFRLGVFSDLKYWNPQDIPWEKWPVEKRPMVTVRKPEFSRDDWTHVVFTFENINSSKDQSSTATLYLNGRSMGSMQQPLKFTWDLQHVAIMLGIEYIGDMDDLMIFRRALSPDEVQFLYKSPTGL